MLRREIGTLRNCAVPRIVVVLVNGRQAGGSHSSSELMGVR